MGNRLRDLRFRRNLSMQDMVDTVRVDYPKFDKPLQSKCERTELYAVELTYPAFKTLYMKFDPEGWKKYKTATDGHLLTCRISGRLPEDIYRKFIAQIHQDGFSTVQAWIADHVLAYVNSRSDDT